MQRAAAKWLGCRLAGAPIRPTSAAKRMRRRHSGAARDGLLRPASPGADSRAAPRDGRDRGAPASAAAAPGGSGGLPADVVELVALLGRPEPRRRRRGRRARRGRAGLRRRARGLHPARNRRQPRRRDDGTTGQARRQARRTAGRRPGRRRLRELVHAASRPGGHLVLRTVHRAREAGWLLAIPDAISQLEQLDGRGRRDRPAAGDRRRGAVGGGAVPGVLRRKDREREGRGRRTGGRWGNSWGGARREASGCATSRRSTWPRTSGDRALLSVMLYSFARVSAVLGMRRQDYFGQGSRGWLRLHEKGGKRHRRAGPPPGRGGPRHLRRGGRACGSTGWRTPWLGCTRWPRRSRTDLARRSRRSLSRRGRWWRNDDRGSGAGRARRRRSRTCRTGGRSSTPSRSRGTRLRNGEALTTGRADTVTVDEIERVLV